MLRFSWQVLLIVITLLVARAGISPTPPAASLVAARAAVLLDRQSGMVLWEHDAHARLPMASTTKVMTAMVILDLGSEKLTDEVQVSEYAGSMDGSSVLDAGWVTSLDGLLKAALLSSSNEATVAAAEYLCGTEAAFVAHMNAKARELGLRDTHFVNPHGLYHKDHYSTAYDLAVMAQHALTYYPLIRRYVATTRDSAEAATRGTIILENRNRLLGKPVPGVPNSVMDGVKTGYVQKSGRCLVASATCGSWQLISVVLNSPDMFGECQRLLQYGFTRYAWKTYASEQQPGVSVKVARGAKSVIPVGAKGGLGVPVLQLGYGGDEIEDRIVFTKSRLTAPVQQYETVGTLELRRNGRVIATAPAIALAASPVAWWWYILVGLWYLLAALAALLVLGLIYGAYTKTTRRRRRLLQARGGDAHQSGPDHR